MEHPEDREPTYEPAETVPNEPSGEPAEGGSVEAEVPEELEDRGDV